ncbi:hypothetical protein GWK47_028355 [Chionoecetes opilio]|uniref:HTH CENPB-type domain-containing protein n=1 Tax=Chionoecetes opilio TaxID=41210 RepID=A0A8J5D2I1_CHIOP|nr:hypothetical protein GWK47_028355 [Chionoecetes opilio]
MEKILNRWISEQVDQRKSNVDGVAIREKARSIYDHLAEKEPSGSSPAPRFIASHGWFHRFKQRFSLHNIARTDRDDLGEKVHLPRSFLPEEGMPTFTNRQWFAYQALVGRCHVNTPTPV